MGNRFAVSCSTAPRLQERSCLFRQKDVYPEDARRTDGALFMNGLVLLRLAELSGRPTQREDPNIPHLARLPVGKPPLPLDSWMRPDEELPAQGLAKQPASTRSPYSRGHAERRIPRAQGRTAWRVRAASVHCGTLSSTELGGTPASDARGPP